MSFNNTYFTNSNDRNIRMANAGPSTPVKFYKGMGYMQDFGAGRVNNVRPKEGYTMRDVFGPPVDRASTNEDFDTFRKIAQVDTKIAQGGNSGDFDKYLRDTYGFTREDKIYRRMPGHLQRDLKDSFRIDTEKNKQSNLTDRVTDFISKIFTPPAVAGTLDENRDFVSDFSGELTSNIFNRDIPNVDDMVRDVGAAFDDGGIGGLSVSEPSQRRTVRIGGISFPQSRFGKPQPRVQSPMEAGMGTGAERARNIADANIREGGVARGKSAAKSKAQSAAKARKAAGQTVSGVNARNKARMKARARARNKARNKKSKRGKKCDLRCKVDISLLTSMNLMRDDLAEVAYFVKELQEIT